MHVKTENPWKAQNKNEMRKNFLPIFIWETDEKQKNREKILQNWEYFVNRFNGHSKGL